VQFIKKRWSNRSFVDRLNIHWSCVDPSWTSQLGNRVLYCRNDNEFMLNFKRKKASDQILPFKTFRFTQRVRNWEHWALKSDMQSFNKSLLRKAVLGEWSYLKSRWNGFFNRRGFGFNHGSCKGRWMINSDWFVKVDQWCY